MHYKWTSGDGGFVTDDNPDGDASEVTTQSAQWKAPEEPGDYTVTCTIDDEPAAVEEPDTGDRDDDPLTRTVHIKVEVGESSATLKLYKDAELTEEATGTIGGTVYVVLEVTLGKYQKLVSNNATLRIEENYEEHSEAERRWDRSVNLEDGWQKKDANDEWQATTETPQSKNTSGDEKYFRKVWSWATYSQPLGHNEEHTVEIVKVDDGEDTELSFTPTNEGDDGKDGPEAVNADVKNLAIESVDPSDYFLVNSDDTEPVNFSVKLADYEEDAEYSLTLTIRHTADPSTIIKTITQTGTGLTHTISWDLTDDSETPATTYGGYFTFDLIVSKDGGDTQQYRSPYLTLTQDDLSLETDENGNLVRSTGGKIKTIFKYKLSEAPKSGSASVHFFKELDEVSSKTGLSKQNRWNPEDPPVTVSLDLGEPPSVRAIMTALDDRGDSYRDHLPKRMLNYNKGRAAYMKYAALTFNLIGNGNLGSHLIEWSKVEDVNGGIVSSWGHNNSWEANSSQTTINSDDPADYWRENGPIPVSNNMNNTVAQNTSKHCWWVKADTSYMISPSTAHNSGNAGMYWCKPDGIPKFFGDKYGNYRAWRFQILDGQYSDEGHTPIKHYPGAEYGVSRDYLRVHEDQGQIGSSGCIAVKPGLMEQVWPRLRNIGDAAAAWGNKYYIPLMVFDRNGSTNNPHESASWGSNSP